MKPTDFSKYLTLYLSSYLPSQRNVSKNTISSYCDTFALFLSFCKEDCDISIERLTLNQISADLVKNFLKWLEDKRDCCASTCNQRLAAIHSFFRYVQVESPQNIYLYQKILAIPYKKKSKPAVNYLTVEDLKLILSQPDTTVASGRRNFVLLSVLYDTGARVQELADLKVRHVRTDNPAKVYLTGKGRKSREVPLMTKTKTLLEHYLIEQNLNTPDKLDFPLFFNKQSNKLTRAGISYILEKYTQQARVISPSIPSVVTPHVLRHTKAMHLLQAGIEIVYIRDILGHVDISTTEVYARADTEMKRSALEKNNCDSVVESLPSWASNTDLMTWLKGFNKSL